MFTNFDDNRCIEIELASTFLDRRINGIGFLAIYRTHAWIIFFSMFLFCRQNKEYAFSVQQERVSVCVLLLDDVLFVRR